MSLVNRMPAFVRARLAGRQVLQRALNDSVWLFADQLLRMGLSLITGVWIARYLGPDRYGWFSYATAAVGMATSLTSLGINAVVVRDLVRAPDYTAMLMGSAFGIRLIGALASLGICIGLTTVRAPPVQAVSALILILAVGMVCQTFDVIDLLFQAKGQQRVSAWVRMFGCGIASLAKIALIVFKAPLEAFAVASAAELAIDSVCWLWASAQRGWHLSAWRWSRTFVGRLLRESWPLALAGVAIYAQAYTDQLVIGSMLSANDLGQYAAAMRLVSAFGFVPMVIYTVAAPELTRAKLQDEALYRQRLFGLYRMMFLLFVAIAAPLALLGPFVTRLLYGLPFAQAASLLPWLAFRLFFTNFGVARTAFVTNEGLFGFSLITAVAGAVTNIALNFVLVRSLGSIGAIVSSMVSFTVTTFALDIFEPRARANLRLMLLATVFPFRRTIAG